MYQNTVIPARCAPPDPGSRPFNRSCKPYLNLDSRFTLRCPGMTRKGFTLIELLVVVLIIGILSSVALPQYQKAVLKARFANMRQVAAQYKSAEEAYYLANGSYTNQINDLDISFPSCRLVSDVLVCDNYFMLDPLFSSVDGADFSTANLRLTYCPAAIQGNYTECYTAADFVYTVWLTYSSKPEQTECAGKTAAGTAFCRSVK